MFVTYAGPIRSSAHSALRRAVHEAQLLRHGALRSEHLLLGLLGDVEVVSLLATLGVTASEVERAVRVRLVRGSDAMLEPLPRLTGEVRDVLMASREEARGMGHRAVGNCHIVLGLLAPGEGLGSEILIGYGAALDSLRFEVLELVAEFDAA